MILNLFQKLGSIKKNSFKCIEKYSTVEASCEMSNLSFITNENLQDFTASISQNDNWTLRVTVGDADPITLSSIRKNVVLFVKEVSQISNYLVDEVIRLDLTINKGSQDNIINIYDFNSFNSYFAHRSVFQILNTLKKGIKPDESLVFRVMGEKIEEFYSAHISFINSDSEPKNHVFNSQITHKESCHFTNYSDFPYGPIQFYLIQRPSKDNDIVKKLDRLSWLFSIICLFDITSMSEIQLHFKLNGYKTIDSNILLDSHPVQSRDVYYEIFRWVYADYGNINDKIGLARNILSISISKESLEIESSVFNSIKSGFKTYLQGNLNRYMEVRNQISEQLVSLTEKISNVADSFMNNFQKSNFTFILFFISVFIIQVFNTKQLNDVVSKEATIIALGLLTISLIYLFYSIWLLKAEKQRIKNRYANMKSRFQDLLIEKDINNILNHDKDFNDEIKFLESRQCKLTVLWIATVLIFLVVLLSTSSYLNWKVLCGG